MTRSTKSKDVLSSISRSENESSGQDQSGSAWPYTPRIEISTQTSDERIDGAVDSMKVNDAAITSGFSRHAATDFLGDLASVSNQADDSFIDFLFVYFTF